MMIFCNEHKLKTKCPSKSSCCLSILEGTNQLIKKKNTKGKKGAPLKILTKTL